MRWHSNGSADCEIEKPRSGAENRRLVTEARALNLHRLAVGKMENVE